MLVAQAANHMSAQRCYLQKTLLNHMMQGSGIDMARLMSWTSFSGMQAVAAMTGKHLGPRFHEVRESGVHKLLRMRHPVKDEVLQRLGLAGGQAAAGRADQLQSRLQVDCLHPQLQTEKQLTRSAQRLHLSMSGSHKRVCRAPASAAEAKAAAHGCGGLLSHAAPQ